MIWREVVWAVEHHLSGQYAHASDYQRFMEEEGFEICPWWRGGVQIGLLVMTFPAKLEPVRTALIRQELPGLTWRVATQEAVLRVGYSVRLWQVWIKQLVKRLRVPIQGLPDDCFLLGQL